MAMDADTGKKIMDGFNKFGLGEAMKRRIKKPPAAEPSAAPSNEPAPPSNDEKKKDSE